MASLKLGSDLVIGEQIATDNFVGGGSMVGFLLGWFERVSKGETTFKMIIGSKWSSNNWIDQHHTIVRNPALIAKIKELGVNLKFGKVPENRAKGSTLLIEGGYESHDSTASISGGRFASMDNGNLWEHNIKISELNGFDFRGDEITDTNFPFVQDFFRTNIQEDEITNKWFPDVVLNEEGALILEPCVSGIGVQFIYRDTRVVTHNEMKKGREKVEEANKELLEKFLLTLDSSLNEAERTAKVNALPLYELNTGFKALLASTNAKTGKASYKFDQTRCLDFDDTRAYFIAKGFDSADFGELDYWQNEHSSTTTTTAENNAAATIVHNLGTIDSSLLNKDYIKAEITKGNTFDNIAGLTDEKLQTKVAKWIEKATK